MSTINGLPAHVLLVHLVVVLLPLSAALLVAGAVRPSLRRRFAGPTALLSLLVLAVVPLTTSAGEWLERHTARSELVHKHAELGDTAIVAAIAVAVAAIVVWWRDREGLPLRRFLLPESRAATAVVAAVSIVIACGAVYDVYRIGDSGAKASWSTTVPRRG